jgi:hypothetical protein
MTREEREHKMSLDGFWRKVNCSRLRVSGSTPIPLHQGENYAIIYTVETALIHSLGKGTLPSPLRRGGREVRGRNLN